MVVPQIPACLKTVILPQIYSYAYFPCSGYILNHECLISLGSLLSSIFLSNWCLSTTGFSLHIWYITVFTFSLLLPKVLTCLLIASLPPPFAPKCYQSGFSRSTPTRSSDMCLSPTSPRPHVLPCSDKTDLQFFKCTMVRPPYFGACCSLCI